MIFLQMSCALPQAILLYRGRERILPDRPFSLGRLGSTINAVAVLWAILLIILSFLPTERPVTKENMNYVVVVSVGLIGLVLSLYFFSKRGSFKGPRDPSACVHGMIDVLHINERRLSDGDSGLEESGGHHPLGKGV